MQELEVFGVNITPTVVTVFPKKRKKSHLNKLNNNSYPREKTEKQIENEINLKKNNHSGKLSFKASQRLKNAVNWLIHVSDEKRIKSPCGLYSFNFRLNMITLTLPFLQEELTDNYIKSKLLNPFLTYLRVKHNLTHYVWKAETQENGNLHFHIITNTYIHHSDIRRIWNNQLKKENLLKKYSQKFNKMNFKEYLNYSKSIGEKNIKKISKRFYLGKLSKWENPNSTDVHSLRKIKNIGAYISTYLAKKEEGRRGVSGRIWGTSESLSTSRKLTTYVDVGDYIAIDDLMKENKINYKDIEAEGDLPNEKYVVARVYFIELNILKKIAKKWIKEEIDNFLRGIKNFYEEEKQKKIFN